MSDDLIERFSDYVEVALDPSGAAQALTAAQARIAELEKSIDDALFAIALNLSFCPDDLGEAQKAVVHTGLVADRLRSSLFPDQDEEQEPFTSAVKECGVAIDAAHERGRLQGLDEAVDEMYFVSNGYAAEGDMKSATAVHDAARCVEALKAKGGE